jgi:hypothetical protein
VRRHGADALDGLVGDRRQQDVHVAQETTR